MYQSDLMTSKLGLGSERFHVHEWPTMLTLLTPKKDYEKLYSGIDVLNLSFISIAGGNYFRV